MCLVGYTYTIATLTSTSCFAGAEIPGYFLLVQTTVLPSRPK
jgi:hypothetical protein